MRNLKLIRSNTFQRTWKYFILFILISSISCRDDDGPPLNDTVKKTELSVIWKRSLHKDDIANSNSILSQIHPVFEQGFLLATTEGVENRWINLINPENGKDIWKWNDIFEAPSEKIEPYGFYEKNDIFHYIVGSKHYWINLNDGSTFNKIRREVSFNNSIFGIDDKYYITGDPVDTLQGYKTKVVYEGKFSTGELKQTVVPNFLLNNAIANRIGQVTSVVPLVHEQKEYLVITWQDIFPNWHFVTYLQLYDNVKKKWVYDKVVLNVASQKGVLKQPLKIVGDKVYIQVAKSILCHNIWDGEQIWKHEFPHDFFFSGFIVEDDMVVGNCENTVLYGLNAETGNLLWEGQGSGTSSKLEGRYLNGVVYFSGGAPRKIFAVEISTGKTLWALEAQNFGDIESWKGDIYVIPGKNQSNGKVIACTHMYAYCFEAAR